MRTSIAAFVGSVFAAGVLAPIGLAQSPPAEVSLRPRWVVGASDTYRVVQDSSKEQTPPPGGPRASKRSIRQEVTLTRTVLSHDEAGTRLELRILGVKMDAVTEDKRIGFDSALPDGPEQDPQLGDPIRRIIGKPIEVVLDRDSDVKEIQGNKSTNQGLEPYPQTIMGDTFIGQVLRPLYRLPSAPATAGVGRTWDRVDSLDLPPMGTLRTILTSTVASIQGQDVTVDLRGTMSISRALGPGAVKTRIRSQSIEGSYVWDAAAGTLKNLRQSDRLELDLEYAAGTVAASNHTTTTFERLTARADPSSPPAKVGGASTPDRP